MTDLKILMDAASFLPKDLNAKLTPPGIICIPRHPISFSPGSDDSANFVLKVTLLGDDGEMYDHEVPIESATPQKVADAIASFARRAIEVKRAEVVAKEEAARERERRAEIAKVKSGANPLKQRIWVPQLLTSLMLLWALNPDNPYGYYILLRWVCCGVFAYLAFKAFGQEQQGWAWVLGITAAVYNPVIRVHLTREMWSVVNVITIGIAIASVFAIKFKDEKRDTGESGDDIHRGEAS